jgi:D-alanyl-D-alanine carboxypeptidase/D-alanyl-D-alanine-endopeptidase (penicillin-binding protein 4)
VERSGRGATGRPRRRDLPAPRRLRALAVQPRAGPGLVALLDWARDREWSAAFLDSLPTPGEGTLDGRLDGVTGVHAKTGTLTGTRALSGVVRRGGRPDVVFSALLSGLTVREDEARDVLDAFIAGL